MPQLLLDACMCQKERRILHALGRSLFEKVWTEGLSKEIDEAVQSMFNWRSELEESMNVSSKTSDEDVEQKIHHGTRLTTEDSRCQNKLSDETIAKFYMKKRQDHRVMVAIDLRLIFFVTLHKIWQNMGFLRPLYFRIRTESTVLCLFGNIRARKPVFSQFCYQVSYSI